MAKANNNYYSVQKLTLGAMLTALVILLQLIPGAVIRFGVFQVSLVLVPIVVGAAVCGPYIGAWLGFVFGMVVLLNGDAAPFYAVSPVGTVLTVLLKGALAGLAAGLVFRWLSGYNVYLGVIAAAVVCPVVNTGVFLLGCLLFFLPTLTEWAGGQNVYEYMILGLVGGNFLFELGFNVLLSPIILRLLRISKKMH